MIGALIGDLAASTWEKDKSIFYSNLIVPESQPSIYGITLMSAANLKLSKGEYTHQQSWKHSSF